MKHRIGKAGVIALAIYFATGVSHANVGKFEAAGKSLASSQSAAVKLVDINSASKTELKALAGIDDALAGKIIAGRPYLSKAFLVTRNIIPTGIYGIIKQQIIAKQK